MKQNLSIIVSWLLIINAVSAQKISAFQPISVYAPANVKIDGMGNEWDGNFMPYNKNIQAYYTLSNDNDNLYLVIHAVKSSVIEKMVEGGISFTISKSGQKSDKSNISVLYPLISFPTCRNILQAAGKKLSEGKLDPKIVEETATGNKISISKANQILFEKAIEIKISGPTAITDTIRITNTNYQYFKAFPLHLHPGKFIVIDNNKDGLQAKSVFNEKGEYTYELLLPIKYITLNAGAGKFHYNITINGRGEDSRPGSTFWRGRGEMLYMDMETPTDFWGEYTLAKKL